jgi:hypothetical protein
MNDEVTVMKDEIEAYADGTVARVRVLSVPASDRFPEGVKYTFHYGEAGAEYPIVRYDNHHGKHERHDGATTTEIEFPGLDECYRRWRSVLPESKQSDW